MKSLVVSLFLMFSVAAQAQTTVAVDSNYVFNGYTEKLVVFKALPVAKKSIIFLGNSLTDAGRWNDIAPELPILNRGISGDNSFGVYARLDEIVRHQPAKLFLMIGVNDLKRGIPTSYIIQNYKKIVARVHKESPKTRIYLSSILPINESKLIDAFKSVRNSDIQVLNTALKSIAASHKSARYIDLHVVFADKSGQLREDVTPDGIHLEVSAYIEYVDYLKKIKAL